MRVHDISAKYGFYIVIETTMTTLICKEMLHQVDTLLIISLFNVYRENVFPLHSDNKSPTELVKFLKF